MGEEFMTTQGTVSGRSVDIEDAKRCDIPSTL